MTELSQSHRLCLLVEDQPSNQAWMTQALHGAFDTLEVVAVSSLKTAREWLGQNDPARLWLALIDLGLPDGCGVELIETLSAASPATKIIVATIYDDDQHLFNALSAGAQGYILKDQDCNAMITLLRRVEAGEPALSPSIARRLLQYFQSAPSEADLSSDVALTGRETETLTLLARGLTINEVARHLSLKPQTIAGYVKVIYQKLNVSSRAEATLKAVQRGLA